MQVKIRASLTQALNVLLIFSTSFMFWKCLSVFTNSSSPLVVVLSGSMEPAFQRGDILVLWNREERLDVGDIVVYNIKDKSIPIVHRVLREHSSPEKQLLLTKGDNNPVDDLNLYAHGQHYLDREKDILGSVKGYIPKVGYFTILLTENQYAKIALFAILGLSTILQGDE